jgi:hypothetical protein
MDIHDFIKQKPYLVWHVKNLDNLSEESIVEHTLNYGDFDDVRKLFEILTIEKVAEIFRKQIKKKRSNYTPKVKNYFTLLFNKYV